MSVAARARSPKFVSRAATQPAPPSAVAPLACQRDEFSIPRGVHYLNCAYMSPMSRTVEAAGMNGLLRKRVPTAVAPVDFFTGPDRLRGLFADLVNAETPRRVALVPSVSYAMATAARNVPLVPGQHVVMIGDEFPSAVLPWRRLARERGANVRTVAAPETESSAPWSERIHDAIDTNTAVVVLSHAHWSDGSLFDVAAIARRARDVGAFVVVDGTQSVGALPFDVDEVRPDLLVCAGYKWLMGGYGLSLAYFGERFDGGMPLEEVWTSQLSSNDFSRLAEYRDAYREDAERFDGGQRASFVLVPMLCASIEQLLQWRPERVQAYCAALLEPWLDRAEAYGVRLAPSDQRAAHLFGLRVTGGRDVRALTPRLRAKNLHVSVRGDAIRVSPHVYNDASDFEALFAALGE